jgi:hypothetical protein
MRNLFCLVAIVVMLCMTTFAAPNSDQPIGKAAAVDSVSKASPVPAVDVAFEATDLRTDYARVAIDIASAVAIGQERGAAFWPPDIEPHRSTSTRRQQDVWTPILTSRCPPAEPTPVLPNARSGSHAF